MPIIKATKGEYTSTIICSEDSRLSEVRKLIEKGYTDIHDAETGEKYIDIMTLEIKNK
jgi:hypothetical protein